LQTCKFAKTFLRAKALSHVQAHPGNRRRSSQDITYLAILFARIASRDHDIEYEKINKRTRGEKERKRERKSLQHTLTYSHQPQMT